MSANDRNPVIPYASMVSGNIYSVNQLEKSGETIQFKGKFEAPNTLWDEDRNESVTLAPERTSEIVEIFPEDVEAAASAKAPQEIVKFYIAVEQFADWQQRVNLAMQRLAELCGGVTVQDGVGCWRDERGRVSWPEQTKVLVVGLESTVYASAYKVIGEIFDEEKAFMVERSGPPGFTWNMYGLVKKLFKTGRVKELMAAGHIQSDFSTEYPDGQG